MISEATIEENLLRAKKNKYHYSIATEAFTAGNRDFVVSNLSLKKDYADDYDFLNFRRGLAYVEQIIDFNHSELTLARKGLRKFRDLLPEYIDIKESHVNHSRYHGGEKQRLFKNMDKINCHSYLIYNSQKLNGENAQISFVYDQFWVIGSKNKTLIISNESDLEKIKNKHEHKLTTLIAKSWFQILRQKTQEEIAAIKLELAQHTLVGQYCNSENMQHLVHYGKEAHLYFYALVQKANLIEDCVPTSVTIKFLQKFNLPKAKFQIHEAKTYDETLERLREIVIRMNELPLQEGGEGSVLYVSGIHVDGEQNLLICKVKTIEYRIFRKLREKLKDYLKKYNKSYENLHKKYTKEIGEISREFKLKRPLEDYIELGKKAFILCEDQTKPISRFISNKFIDFLKLLEKNIPKDKFMEIVNSKTYELEEDENQLEEELQKKESNDIEEQKPKIEEPKKESLIKKIIVLIPVTIPSTGKTTLLDIVSKKNPTFRLWSVSSDEIKSIQMAQMMKRKKTLSKSQAFEKCRTSSNKQYYRQMSEVFKSISQSEQVNHVFYLDKNHPESALKESIKTIDEKSGLYPNLKVSKLALLPECIERLQQKSHYRYPFSAAYILTCLKRILSRPEHLTLQGSEEHRCIVVFGFANLFRNYSLSPYNLGKYFDQTISFTFNNEKCIDMEKDSQLYKLFLQILLKGKPGDFKSVHLKLDSFIESIKQWELKELPIEELALEAMTKLQAAFTNFDNLHFEKEEAKESKEGKEE